MRSPLLVLALVWVAAVLLVNPLGNFPLNDDWCYGAAVRSLVEEGTYRPLGWTTITLVSQALWGALFSVPFGFSFEALRVSTLVLGLAGVWGTYLLIRRVGGGGCAAILGALVVAANPIYFALSHTFMSDVPFLAATIFALFFFVRSLQTGSDRDVIAGTLLATAAVLCRKLGLFLPVSFAIVTLLRGRFSRASLVRAALPLAFGLAALAGFEAWLRESGRAPVKYDMQTKVFWHILTKARAPLLTAHIRVLASVIYLGLFLAPLLILLPGPGSRPAVRRGLALGALLLGAVVSLFLLLGGTRMPLGINILDAGGIGPVTLRDVFILKLPHAPSLSDGFWNAVTIAGVFGGSFLAARVIGALAGWAARPGATAPGGTRAIPVFLLLGSLVYAAPLFVDSMFDRYLLPLVPLLLAFLASTAAPGGARGSRSREALAAAAVLLFLAFSVCGVHDYLAWNRARWKGLNVLVEEQNIDPSRIDGGYEFNGLMTYEEGFRPLRGKSWWWVRDDEYVLAMGPLPGHEVVSAVPYARWMPAGSGRVLVLRRETGNLGDPR